MVFSNGLNKRTHFSKGKIKMEIIIIIAVLIGLIWWFFLRTPADVTFVSNKIEAPAVSDPAPVVVETAPVVVETAPMAVTESVVEPVAVTPMVVPPVKKPRKPRAPKAVVEPVKVVAKKAAPVKKAAAVKAAPRKTRSKKV